MPLNPRRIARNAATGCLLAGLASGLLGCAETELALHTAKVAQDGGTSDLRTEYGGVYKVGTPYQIGGQWYYPAVDYTYTEVGTASWYGPNFHGKLTANGETFNQWALTAAHRTLPMPSFVRVTNLENGRSVVARINDRGPFAKGRIIDMSRRGAQLLGFEGAGTARVRVEIMADLSRQVALRAQGGIGVDGGRQVNSPITAPALPKASVDRQSLAAPAPGLSPVGQAAAAPAPVAPGGIFVQAGSFSVYENANRARQTLSAIGPVEMTQVFVNGRDWYRVRVGPFASPGEGTDALAQIIRAGFNGARLVTN